MDRLTEQLRGRCEQLEAGRRQLQRRTAEAERLQERTRSLQTETAAARSRADQLSQRLLDRDGQSPHSALGLNLLLAPVCSYCQ